MATKAILSLSLSRLPYCEQSSGCRPWERLRPHYSAGELGCEARWIATPSIGSLGGHEGGEFFFGKINGHRVLSSSTNRCEPGLGNQGTRSALTVPL
jgi:hypothetical protein